MKMLSKAERRFGILSSVGLAALAMTSPAMAQDAAETEEQAVVETEETETDSDATSMVVTGSRIRRPELTSSVPVTTFGGDQVYRQAENNVGELLNDLPAFRQTVSQSNPGLSIGIAGLNLLDLRGLGVQRTLVLVNGRRHVAADISATASAVDINSIPSALIERVDIVTGGNSAVYGSDAIAGVVNFVLRDNYDGVDLRANAGITEVGAGENFLISGVAGTNFADGRGNVTVAGEYSYQERVFASQLPHLRSNDGLFQTSNDPAGRSSDGIPDSIFIRDSRSGTISQFGLVAFPQRAPRAECGGSTLTGLPFNCNYIFTPNGNLVPQTFDARVSNSQFGGFFGGNGDTGREGQLTSVRPKNERYSVNLFANYEFSPALETFLEAKYIRAATQGSNSGPAFFQGRFTFTDPRVRFRLDNPFLNPQARAIIEQELLADGRINDLIAGGPISPAAVADGSQRFTVNRNLIDLGLRDEDTVRETYRIVVGARGDITPNLSYEISGNYGRTEQSITVLGNIFRQRLLLALDAGLDPADGRIKCRSQFDPAAAVGVAGIPASELAGDIAACVPYNAFGAADNRAAADYILADAGNFGKLEQYNVVGFVSGTTEEFFKLPGGPVGFVFGSEYRREDAFFRADPAIEQGLTFTNPLVQFDPQRPLDVIEGFAEFNFPLLSDIPFFEELSVSAAGRVSNYAGPVGTTYAYNLSGRWSPFSDLAFRANYGQAVRAPNYTETSGEPNVTFITVTDPCASTRINQGSQFRAANCRADLGAILDDPGYQQVANAAVSTEGLNGDNPNLFEETSISYTIGGVYQPSWLPGFAITVDYYNIEVQDVIASVAGNTIIATCYDLPTLNNPFCGNFERNGTGRGPRDEEPGQVLQGSILQSPLNFANRLREGIDVDVSYRKSIAEDAFINARLIYTHVLTSSNFENPTTPAFENRILSELGDPQDEFALDIDLTFGAVTFGYGARYIGPQLTTTYEAQFPLNGGPPQNPDASFPLEYPDTVYHDLRLALQIKNSDGGNAGEFYFGVENLLDTNPPLGLTGLGDGSAIFETFGRRYFAGVRALF